MATGIIDIIKRASLDAVDNAQMCDIRYGTVTSVKPLKVYVTNNFTIPEKLLIVPEHLTDYQVEFTFDNESDDAEEVAQYVEHYWRMPMPVGGPLMKNIEIPRQGTDKFVIFKPTPTLTGSKKPKHKITIYNALKVGDKVALLRKQGGQSYFILDRVRGD